MQTSPGPRSSGASSSSAGGAAGPTTPVRSSGGMAEGGGRAQIAPLPLSRISHTPRGTAAAPWHGAPPAVATTTSEGRTMMTSPGRLSLHTGRNGGASAGSLSSPQPASAAAAAPPAAQAGRAAGSPLTSSSSPAAASNGMRSSPGTPARSTFSSVRAAAQATQQSPAPAPAPASSSPPVRANPAARSAASAAAASLWQAIPCTQPAVPAPVPAPRFSPSTTAASAAASSAAAAASSNNVVAPVPSSASFASAAAGPPAFPSLFFDDDDDFDDDVAVSMLDAAQLQHSSAGQAASAPSAFPPVAVKPEGGGGGPPGSSPSIEEALLSVSQLPAPLLAADPRAEELASHAGPHGQEAAYLFGLNEAQRRAVLAPPGPLMILACAGSGKTKTLERRIMHLLSTPGVSARSVLAITFSRKAATELAERVKASLNAGLVNARPHAASDVQISTFHALALRTLVDEWEAAGFPQVPHVADAREQKAMMCEVLRDWVATQSGGAGVAAALGEEAKAIRANPLIRPAIEGIVDELMEKLASAASSASRGGGSRRGGGGDPDRAPFAVAHSTGHRPHNDGPGGKEHLTSVEHSLIKYFLAFVRRCKKSRMKKSSNNDSNINGGNGSPAAVSLWSADAFPGAHGWVCSQYLARCHRRACLELDDLVARMVELMERDVRVRNQLHERYHHVMCDEFQDVSEEQFRLLRLIVGQGLGLNDQSRWGSSAAGPNITVVGDDDQSIYSWRGSLVHSFAMFVRAFPGAHSVTLNRTYRSSGTIVKAVSELIAHNVARTPKNLVTSNPQGEKIGLVMAQDATVEAKRIVIEIRRRTSSMPPPPFGAVAADMPVGMQPPLRLKDIAILSRTRRPLEHIGKVLAESGIPCNPPLSSEAAEQARKVALIMSTAHGVAAAAVMPKDTPKLQIHSKVSQDLLAYLELILHASGSTEDPAQHANNSSMELDDAPPASAWDGPLVSNSASKKLDLLNAAFLRVVNLPKRSIGKTVLEPVNALADDETKLSLLRAARVLCGLETRAGLSTSAGGGMSGGLSRLGSRPRELLRPFLDLLTNLQRFAARHSMADLLERLMSLIKYEAITAAEGGGSSNSKDAAAHANVAAMRAAARQFDSAHPAQEDESGGTADGALDGFDRAAALAAARAAAAEPDDDSSGVASSAADAVGQKRKASEKDAAASFSGKKAKRDAAVSSSSSASAVCDAAAASDGAPPSVPLPFALGRLRSFLGLVRSGAYSSGGKNARSSDQPVDAVFLNTIHQAKGLEFSLVFVVHFCDGHMPLPPRAAATEDALDDEEGLHGQVAATLSQQAANQAQRMSKYMQASTAAAVAAVATATGDKDASSALLPSLLVPVSDDEEERRLAYVACTRAKHTLILSVVLKNAEGMPQVPSPFLDEIPEELIAGMGKNSGADINQLFANGNGKHNQQQAAAAPSAAANSFSTAAAAATAASIASSASVKKESAASRSAADIVMAPATAAAAAMDEDDEFDLDSTSATVRRPGSSVAPVVIKSEPRAVQQQQQAPPSHPWARSAVKCEPAAAAAAAPSSASPAARPAPVQPSVPAASSSSSAAAAASSASGKDAVKLSRAARQQAKRDAAAEAELVNRPWMADFQSAFASASQQPQPPPLPQPSQQQPTEAAAATDARPSRPTDPPEDAPVRLHRQSADATAAVPLPRIGATAAAATQNGGARPEASSQAALPAAASASQRQRPAPVSSVVSLSQTPLRSVAAAVAATAAANSVAASQRSPSRPSFPTLDGGDSDSDDDVLILDVVRPSFSSSARKRPSTAAVSTPFVKVEATRSAAR